MAESRNFNASLNAKGLDGAVTEEQARRMCATQGSSSLFIIEAHHGKLVTDEDGTQRIHLVADTVELIPDEHEDRVRTFMRALYMARPDQYGQAAFETPGDGEVPLDTAAADLDALVETDGEGEVTGVWVESDVAGTGEAVNADTGEVTQPGEPLPPIEDSGEKADNVVEFSAP